jgi:hypothetical protein
MNGNFFDFRVGNFVAAVFFVDKGNMCNDKMKRQQQQCNDRAATATTTNNQQ